MSYSTTWYHLDKDDKVLTKYEKRPCFSAIRDKSNFEKTAQYLLYVFKGQMKVTQEEAKKYFLFLKSIPEFKELMPKSCVEMARKQEYKVDLHKYNGTKIFTMLTLIRAVVEDPKIVKAVLKFDRKFKYSLSHFSILKLCGSVYQENSNHWITEKVTKENITKGFNTTMWWDDTTPCIQTGLGRHVHETFNHEGDGWMSDIKEDYIKEILAEKGKPKVVTPKGKLYSYDTLQLQGF